MRFSFRYQRHHHLKGYPFTQKPSCYPLIQEDFVSSQHVTNQVWKGRVGSQNFCSREGFEVVVLRAFLQVANS